MTSRSSLVEIPIVFGRRSRAAGSRRQCYRTDAADGDARRAALRRRSPRADPRTASLQIVDNLHPADV